MNYPTVGSLTENKARADNTVKEWIILQTIIPQRIKRMDNFTNDNTTEDNPQRI